MEGENLKLWNFSDPLIDHLREDLQLFVLASKILADLLFFYLKKGHDSVNMMMR